MNQYLERLLSLLIIHDGHCSIVCGSEIHTEAIKLSNGEYLSFRACSTSSMLEVHLINTTKMTNKNYLQKLMEQLQGEYET